ncbi:hypothetical protein GNX71_28440 [Variovorax sp. RKNM96]|uniref:hypothetical protein n=1 Tax=Variovorax sp. RKNM96 TaxID=2681552 RepID=UPI0019811EF2|nr:hypothetical protein [Variovorax sp. RKNM96]QSI33284.1 hypothetical protein GNX71_28440 [Variovorax sp. RKNM96]
MAACTQCREMTGASATVVSHDQLVRGVTMGIAAGREAEALDGLEWYGWSAMGNLRSLRAQFENIKADVTQHWTWGNQPQFRMKI